LSNDEEKNNSLLEMFDFLFGKFYELIQRIKNYSISNNSEEINNSVTLNQLKFDLKDWIKVWDNFVNPTPDRLNDEQVNKLIETMKTKNGRKQIESIIGYEQIKMLEEMTAKNKMASNLNENFQSSLKFNQRKLLNDLTSNTYKPITPYQHVLVYHVPEFLEKHLELNLFNTQGLEKLNDFTTIDYMSATNRGHSRTWYLTQLFEKRNRIDFYQLNISETELKHKEKTLADINRDFNV
jgi:hypothetical protein